MWGFEQPEEESRGGNGVCLNVGQLGLAELQLCNLEMETALVTGGNDTPYAHPARGLSMEKGPLWSEVAELGQSRAGIVPPFIVTLGEVRKLQLAVVW